MSDSEVALQGVEKLVQSRTHFLNFLRKRVASADVAEELLQDAFLKSVEKVGDVRNKENIVAWFYRMLRNSVVDYYCKTGKNPEEPSELLGDFEQHALAAPEPHNEICQCIYPLLENMKPEYREALRAIDLAGGSIRDLATRARITEGNAAVRIHRARAAMRKQVELACGTCAEHHCIDCHCRHA